MLKKDKRGLTILEVLLVFMIVSVMASMGFSSYRTWQRQILLINTKDEIKSGLVRTQQLATAAADNSAWGMHLATSSYTIFSGDFFSEINPNNITWNLNGVEIVDSYITFSDGSGGYSPDVVFSKFDGDTYNTGTINIIVTNQPVLGKNIIVRPSGQID